MSVALDVFFTLRLSHWRLWGAGTWQSAPLLGMGCIFVCPNFYLQQKREPVQTLHRLNAVTTEVSHAPDSEWVFTVFVGPCPLPLCSLQMTSPRGTHVTFWVGWQLRSSLIPHHTCPARQRREQGVPLTPRLGPVALERRQ